LVPRTFLELSLKVKGTFPDYSPYVIKMEPKNNLHGTFLFHGMFLFGSPKKITSWDHSEMLGERSVFAGLDLEPFGSL